MTKHFESQIARLKELILELGAMVERSVERAIESIEARDCGLAEQVIDGDRAIDLKEIEIGEECLHTLALYQPVASDLRFVTSVLTINKDLERIADLAVNMAEQALRLVDEPRLTDEPINFQTESERVRSMLKNSLDALVEMDPQLAQSVLEADDEVDEIHGHVCMQVERALRRSPSDVRSLLEILSTSRHLERIADHAVNISEDVIYMVRGEIRRHNYSKLHN
jgi:phosphate transport system protein